MASSAKNTSVPAHRLGTAVFRVVNGRVCGLHVKNTNVFVVSLLQEPLAVFLGSFRFSHLVESTNSAASHISALSESFIKAFEDTKNPHSVRLLIGAEAHQGENALLQLGHPANMRDHDEEEDATYWNPRIVVSFLVFGIEHEVTLTLCACPENSKDPFIWGLIMDMFRALQRQQLTMSTSSARQSPPRAVASADDPTSVQRSAGLVRGSAARQRPGIDGMLDSVNKKEANGWKYVNTSRARLNTKESAFPAVAPVGAPPTVSGSTRGGRPTRETFGDTPHVRPSTAKQGGKLGPDASKPELLRRVLELEQQLASAKFATPQDDLHDHRSVTAVWKELNDGHDAPKAVVADQAALKQTPNGKGSKAAQYRSVPTYNLNPQF